MLSSTLWPTRCWTHTNWLWLNTFSLSASSRPELPRRPFIFSRGPGAPPGPVSPLLSMAGVLSTALCPPLSSTSSTWGSPHPPLTHGPTVRPPFTSAFRSLVRSSRPPPPAERTEDWRRRFRNLRRLTRSCRRWRARPKPVLNLFWAVETRRRRPAALSKPRSLTKSAVSGSSGRRSWERADLALEEPATNLVLIWWAQPQGPVSFKSSRSNGDWVLTYDVKAHVVELLRSFISWSLRLRSSTVRPVALGWQPRAPLQLTGLPLPSWPCSSP